jgi:hypothetical protein
MIKIFEHHGGMNRGCAMSIPVFILNKILEETPANNIFLSYSHLFILLCYAGDGTDFGGACGIDGYREERKAGGLCVHFVIPKKDWSKKSLRVSTEYLLTAIDLSLDGLLNKLSTRKKRQVLDEPLLRAEVARAVSRLRDSIANQDCLFQEAQTSVSERHRRMFG